MLLMKFKISLKLDKSRDFSGFEKVKAEKYGDMILKIINGYR